MTSKLKVDDGIHYSGDMANSRGFYRVKKVIRTSATLEEIGGEGRTATVHDFQVGDEYKGHCNPRFVTRKAYDRYFESMGREAAWPVA